MNELMDGRDETRRHFVLRLPSAVHRAKMSDALCIDLSLSHLILARNDKSHSLDLHPCTSSHIHRRAGCGDCAQLIVASSVAGRIDQVTSLSRLVRKSSPSECATIVAIVTCIMTSICIYASASASVLAGRVSDRRTDEAINRSINETYYLVRLSAQISVYATCS
jgi:hypothetical protein